MNKSKLFTYLQTEAAEYAIPPLLDVVTERVHDHRMTREPREFHHSETRYHCPPNEGFGHYDSSWGDGWRMRRRGLWIEISLLLAGEKVSACFVPNQGRVVVSDMGDAMSEARELTGNLWPHAVSRRHGGLQRIPTQPRRGTVSWDRMGRDGDDEGHDSEGISVEFEEGMLIVCADNGPNSEPAWGQLQAAICALMLARLRVRAEALDTVARSIRDADAFIEAAGA